MSLQTEIKTFDQLNAREMHSILELRAKVFVVEQECVYLDPDENDQLSHHVMIDHEEELVAYTRFYNDSSDVWHVGRVVVDKGFRGKGLAKQMMQDSLGFILGKNPDANIELSAQVYLIPFYTNLSFTAVGSSYMEDGIPHQRMLYQKKM